MRLLKNIKSLETPRESLPFHTRKVKDFLKKRDQKQCWIVSFQNPGSLGNGAVAGSAFTGIKMVGDIFVPAGEKSVIINTGELERNNRANKINVESTKM